MTQLNQSACSSSFLYSIGAIALCALSTIIGCSGGGPAGDEQSADPATRWISDARGRVETTGDGAGRKIVSVSLGNTAVDDDAISGLKKFPDIERLELQQTSVTGTGLNVLNSLPNLQVLNLEGTAVDDSAVPHLKAMTKLRVLKLTGTKVTDDGLKELVSLPQLQELWL